MVIGRSDAIALFRKWLDERPLIRCQGSFPMHAFSLRGRISVANDSEIRLMADDTESEVVLKITDTMEFGYLDTRDVVGAAPSELDHECCLVVFVGPVGEEGDPPPDSIAFAQVKAD